MSGSMRTERRKRLQGKTGKAVKVTSHIPNTAKTRTKTTVKGAAGVTYPFGKGTGPTRRTGNTPTTLTRGGQYWDPASSARINAAADTAEKRGEERDKKKAASTPNKPVTKKKVTGSRGKTATAKKTTARRKGPALMTPAEARKVRKARMDAAVKKGRADFKAKQAVKKKKKSSSTRKKGAFGF